jgi:hypothetical protein
MKKIKIIAVIISLFFSCIQVNAQLKVISNGYVGINNPAPLYNFDVNGTVRIKPASTSGIIFDNTNGQPTIRPASNNTGFLGRSNLWYNHLWSTVVDANTVTYYTLINFSDERLKENINTVPTILPKVLKVNSHTYNYRKTNFNDASDTELQNLTRQKYGFLAQELNKVFPELVYTSDTEQLSIDYIGMIPILTQAIKELSGKVDSLEKLVKTYNGSQKSDLGSLPDYENPSLINRATLGQNTPNPFNQSTKISYYVPESTKNATLNIYNMNGLQIKSIPIQAFGNGNITINGSELQAGMYIYTLITDGQEVASKRMILTN